MREAIESAAPFRRKGAKRARSPPDSQISDLRFADSVRRSLEQGRASRQAGPSTDPGLTLDWIFFEEMLETSLRNRILTIIFRILSHLLLINLR